jgi:hypothetical protein
MNGRRGPPLSATTGSAAASRLAIARIRLKSAANECAALPLRLSGNDIMDNNRASTSHGRSTAANAMWACDANHRSRMISPGFVKVWRIAAPNPPQAYSKLAREQAAKGKPQRRALGIAYQVIAKAIAQSSCAGLQRGLCLLRRDAAGRRRANR